MMLQLHQERPAGQQSAAAFVSEPSTAFPRPEPRQFRDSLRRRQRDAATTGYPPNGMVDGAKVLLGEPIEEVRMLESLFWMVYSHNRLSPFCEGDGQKPR